MKPFYIMSIIVAGLLVGTPRVHAKRLHTKIEKAQIKKLISRKRVKKQIQDRRGEEAIVWAANKVGVPYEILHAICHTESNLDLKAFVFNDGGEQNHAFGMCQVLRITGEKYIGKSPGCAQDFRSPDLKRSYENCKLFGPRMNALAAARYLKAQIERHGGHVFKAAAAYNTGSLRACDKRGWVFNVHGKKLYRCKPGGLLNARYVGKIKIFLADSYPASQEYLHQADFKIHCSPRRQVGCI